MRFSPLFVKEGKGEIFRRMNGNNAANLDSTLDQAGIDDLLAVHFGKGRQRVGTAAFLHDVQDIPSSDQECVSEELAVALPGYRFGAHERDALLFRDRFQLGHNRVKARRQHEIGIGSKGADLPCAVR